MPAGTPLGLDGFNGIITINPDREKLSRLEKSRQKWLDQRAALLQTSNQPATTRDGRQVEVAANVGSLRDAELGDANGADGIGLLRTEFLFQTGQHPPDEETQRVAIEEIAKLLKPRPVIVRTLDVGGDKELPYINLPEEANPFLGVRAIRLSLREPELFRTQLRAILRAGAQANVRVMFPMVTNLRELRAARQILQEEHQALKERDIPHAWPIQTGIMIEVPGAALTSPILAERGRLLQYRHQRPDSVHAGSRARQRGLGRVCRRPAPGRPTPDPPGGRGRSRSREMGWRLRRAGRRSGCNRGTGRAGGR
jgi:phosphoenolpyruvate-protein kinase (PTS system EI component)